jgi:dTDP-4-amino-4,6-dideoxygalactose transaminase
MQAMLDVGVSTRRGIMCSHREPAYRDRPVRYDLEHSEQAQDHAVLLPMYPDMTPEEQERVALALRRALAAPSGQTSSAANGSTSRAA